MVASSGAAGQFAAPESERLLMNKSITARDMMVRKLITLPPTMDCFEALRLLVKYRISGAPVVDDAHRVVGVFTEKSAMSALMDAAYEQTPSCEVSNYMVRELVTIGPDTDLLEIVQIFRDQPTRRLQIVENERLIGQISRRDVIYKAAQLIQPKSVREKNVLYLSALFERTDAPI